MKDSKKEPKTKLDESRSTRQLSKLTTREGESESKGSAATNGSEVEVAEVAEVVVAEVREEEVEDHFRRKVTLLLSFCSSTVLTLHETFLARHSHYSYVLN